MSRKEWDNEEFRFAAGIDHVTGPFIQIWIQPADEQDEAAVVLDQMKMRIDMTQIPADLAAYLRTIAPIHLRDPAIVSKIAQKCGFAIESQIYALWD